MNPQRLRCILCGIPARDHTEEACKASLAAARGPVGILGSGLGLQLVPGKTCDIHRKQPLDEQGECPFCVEWDIEQDTRARRAEP